ncbi:MAG: carboxypeptidase regulatory-like domain-containing protein, partial [Gemmatimonadota bacterium]|nr:carboxypeptidase regulatory-like domain-containing protein [Gemmatimonadota bacterium]
SGGDDSATRTIPEQPVDTASETGGYVETEVADGGMIRGTVRFKGPAPDPRRFPTGDDADACGDTQLVRPVEIGPDGGVLNAVVSLRDIERGTGFPISGSPVLDQRECEFVPPIVVVRVGDSVRVLNSDAVTHNVHTVGFDNRTVNRTQPAGAPEMFLAFSAPERVKVQCDIHPWMSAWIIVTEHPYVTITDGAGEFRLRSVPPGDHTLEVWHELSGVETRSETVTTGETVDVAVDLEGRG